MNLSRILASVRGVPTIARRELAGFFDQATAYILIVAFLALGIFIEFSTPPTSPPCGPCSICCPGSSRS